MLEHPLTKALLGVCIALGLLGGVESGLRLSGVPDPGLYEGDPATLWRLRPGLDRVVPGPDGAFRVQTNDLGLRGQAPPPGGWALALGCSTTFGWGVQAEESWPAVLADRSGLAVVNGGVPGWSSHQARAGADRWLDLGPDVVILAYGVRDAWPAARTDAQAAPSPAWTRWSLPRLLRGLKSMGAASPTTGALPGTGPTWRVPAPDYAENLRALVAQAAPARVMLLRFPQVAAELERTEPWRAALEEVAVELDLLLLEPELPDSAFFAADPVHLTAGGHGQLAALVQASVVTPSTPAAPTVPR